MPYASLEDVKRVLRVTGVDEARDAQLRASLEAVESWIESRLRHLGRSGNQIEVYFDVAEDATLYLPADDLTVTKIRVFSAPTSEGLSITPSEVSGGPGFDLTDDGRVILRGPGALWPHYTDGGSYLMRYQRVEVHYIGTGVVPRAVTEGVAFLAGGYWQEGPTVFSGLLSEKIGDYSYTLEKPSEAGDVSYTARAAWFLKPFLRKARVSVT